MRLWGLPGACSLADKHGAARLESAFPKAIAFGICLPPATPVPPDFRIASSTAANVRTSASQRRAENAGPFPTSVRAAGHSVVADSSITDRVGVFVELHIEQLRALDLVDCPLALASAIWPHGRWEFDFTGEANHAGATRLVDRHDPMLAFASAVHTARAEATACHAVATFGKVLVSPNGTNAIPSRVRAWLDARAADQPTLDVLVSRVEARARAYAVADGIGLTVHTESVTPIVDFPSEPRLRLSRALAHLGELPVITTAAGHDAGILSDRVPTAMLFVRNPTGVSHSPAEHAESVDCHRGAAALADVMRAWVTPGAQFPT